MSQHNLKYIVTVEGDYVRDTQIFNGDPAAFRDNPHNCFHDLKCPCHFGGIYEGISEDEIRVKAAANLGVHPNVITLTKIEQEVKPPAMCGAIDNAERTELSRLKLKDILGVSFTEVHLVHNEIDNDPATIVELNSDTLTEAGKQAWDDVLSGDVHSVFVGILGLQIMLGGVKARRLDDFSRMLAGYCSESDYRNWVASDADN